MVARLRPQPNFKVPIWECRAYLDWVKTLPCCHCPAYGCDPHHVIGHRAAGMGQTVADFAAVPLCRECHDELHHHHAMAEKLGFTAQGFPQTRWLIETLNRAFAEGVLIATL